MEDNNVNNIILNNDKYGLPLVEKEDTFIGGGDDDSKTVIITPPNPSTNLTLKLETDTTSNDLTPILMILSDSLESEDDTEEPVLLEEDNTVQYTIELNTTLTEIYTINVESVEGSYYTDEEHVIAVLDSNNTIVDNENNEGDIKITAKIDLSWCTVSFVHPLNSPFQLGKYNLSSSNFSHDNDIKVVVPMIHCEVNTGNLRTANIIFLILNLDTNLKMLVIQDAKNEDGPPYKYTIYMVIAINISRKIDTFGNTVGLVIKTNDIDSLTIVNGQYSNALEPTLTYNKFFSQYSKVYNYVVSRLMYAHDIVLTEKLTDDNDKLKLFITNLNKSDCLTEAGGYDEFKSLTYLPVSHKKNINNILGITDDYLQSDSLALYQGENWQENTYWETLNADLTTKSRYNPFDNLGSFIGNNNNVNTTVKKICDITNDDLHLIIYNLTLNTVVKDINWTNWAKKTTGKYNIIARALLTGYESFINANVSGGHLYMTIGETQTPDDINVLQGNAGNYKVSDLLFLIENNRLSINDDGEQFSYLVNSNGLVHNSGYDFTDEYGDYYVIDVSDKITLNGSVVNLKDIDDFTGITICLWFKINSANQPTPIGTIELAGVWPNKEEAYIGYYD